MSVYVDKANLKFRGMTMSHMIADTLNELHAMADTIGVQRQWFQDPKTMKVSFPHYDIAASKKALAIKAGAIECDRMEFVNHMRRLRKVFGVYGPSNPAPHAYFGDAETCSVCDVSRSEHP